jgi:hypothetical protein
MSRIFWDTNLFLYLFEGPENYRRKYKLFVNECCSAAISC